MSRSLVSEGICLCQVKPSSGPTISSKSQKGFNNVTEI